MHCERALWRPRKAVVNTPQFFRRVALIQRELSSPGPTQPRCQRMEHSILDPDLSAQRSMLQDAKKQQEAISEAAGLSSPLPRVLP